MLAILHALKNYLQQTTLEEMRLCVNYFVELS